MNCDSMPLMMSAALDNELSAIEQSAFDAHLSTCQKCREEWDELRSLSMSLKSTLRPPASDLAIERVVQAARAILPNRQLSRDIGACGPSRARPAILVVSLAAILLVSAAIFEFPAEPILVGEVTMATGPLEVKRNNSPKWTPLDNSSRMLLQENIHLRTGQNSLCEIRTRADAVIRLNRESEVILRRPEKVELVSGELWCRTPSTASVQISKETTAATAEQPLRFTCPAACETQWQCMPNQEISCLAVSPAPVELQVEQLHQACIVKPGEAVSFADGAQPSATGHSDQTKAMVWQLPLLILKSPDDQELQQRLAQLLAKIGHTKIRHMYEEQIRQLGPAGTLPLIAFVRSPDSAGTPELRRKAMGIVADLAPASAIGDLKTLSSDSDPLVRNQSLRALRRLQADSESR